MEKDVHVRAVEIMKEHIGENGFLPEVLENQAESEATTVANLKTDFNTLLAALKAAGYMKPDVTA